jgi:hypothetical protein
MYDLHDIHHHGCRIRILPDAAPMFLANRVSGE